MGDDPAQLVDLRADLQSALAQLGSASTQLDDLLVSWPPPLPSDEVELGALLTRARDTALVDADGEYRQITVRLWGRGVVERDVVPGSSLLSGPRYVARTGQAIVSRIDARNGAMGIVPAGLQGALVTNDFPLFDVNEAKILPAFMGWLCRSADFVAACRRASEGTTNRVRLDEEKFLRIKIRLPGIAEQRRIVAALDAADDLVARAQETLQATQQLRDLLVTETIPLGE